MNIITRCLFLIPLAYTFLLNVTSVGTAQPSTVAGPFVNPANGHQYYLLASATWTNAELAAKSLGGHLVTINDWDESLWVYHTFGSLGGDMWIGLYDPNPGALYPNPTIEVAKFKWISGQPAVPSPWFFATMANGETQPDAGFFKIIGPQFPGSWTQSLWADDSGTVQRSGVVELPLDLEIVVQPQRNSVGIGSDAILEVFADGTSTLFYQWRYMGTNLDGQTQSRLVLTNAQPALSGFYDVIVSDASGSITSAPALLSIAGIVTWGDPSATDTRSNVPDGLTSVRAVAAGWFHDLALKPDGTVVAWGDNSHGQLNVPSDLTNVVSIAAGMNHSVALRADGTVVAWGETNEATVPSGLTNIIAIDASLDHTLALTADGTVGGWGGWLGDLTRGLGGITNAVAICAGDQHNLVITADGSVVDLGPNPEGTPLPADLTKVVSVAAGEAANFALRADGTITAWPNEGVLDWLGMLWVPTNLSNVVAISAKADHAIALLANGTVVAWGTNWASESSVPPGLPNVVALATGYEHSLVLLRDGSPKVTIQPWDRAVAPGTSLNFQAKTVGMQSMVYQWQFNGKDIPGATQESLGVTNAQVGSSGYYSLVASNQVGTVSTRQAKLIVGSAIIPSTPTVLAPISLSAGIFSLQLTGTPGALYVLQGSQNLKDWTDLQTNSPSSMPFTFKEQQSPALRFYRVRLAQ
jgi:hypothetical protein